jgi:hypothetical protein
VLAIYMLSGPQTNQIGCYYFSPALAAEDLGPSVNMLTMRLRGICKPFDWQWLEDERLFYVPSWLTWNKPNSVNSAKAWQSEAKRLANARLRDVLLDGIGMPKLSHSDDVATQEQKQEQKQKQEQYKDRADALGETGNPSDRFGNESNFQKFWSAYPRKVGKDAAAKAFGKRRVDDALLVAILAALEQQKISKQWQRDGGQYIPHPATWLNQGRWQDEAAVAPVVQERDLTAADVRRAATIRSTVYGGTCPHEPPCESYGECVGLIAQEQMLGVIA